MKRFIRVVGKSTAVVGLLLCVAATWFYFEFWLPNRMLASHAWWWPEFQENQAFCKKNRKACYKVLRYRFTYHDNAFLALGEIGNKDSIPYLIRALKWGYLKCQDRIATHGRIPVTLSRCINSLEKLTGMNFGIDYEAWENWWQQTGCHLPFDKEKGQLMLPEKEE